MTNFTKGDWKAGNTDVISGSAHIANCYFESRNFKPPPFDEALANAHLIAAAVNACQSVNPDNPMAVAESIKAMYEALKQAKLWLDMSDDGTNRALTELTQVVDKSLAKTEGR